MLLDLFFVFEAYTNNNKIVAPEISLIEVNEAGSIAPSFKAILHSTELAAKAIIASVVKMIVRENNFRFKTFVKVLC